MFTGETMSEHPEFYKFTYGPGDPNVLFIHCQDCGRTHYIKRHLGVHTLCNSIRDMLAKKEEENIRRCLIIANG